MTPSRDDRVLDIGGYADFWTAFDPVVGAIDVLNIHEHEVSPEAAASHGIRSLVGDGRALDIDDRRYDIVHSNSVIEHVGDLDAQRAFAAEARRVGRSLWVQTPAKEFFFEPHFLTPFIHWLPPTRRRRAARFTLWAILTRATRAQAEAMADEIRLLTYPEMIELFPDCDIRRETVLGITKSYVAVRAS